MISIICYRHALYIDYNLATGDDVLSYFSAMEPELSESVHTLEDFMKRESWLGISMMLSLRHDPYMFHQVTYNCVFGRT